MPLHIPIRDPSGYALAIFLVYSLGASSFPASFSTVGWLKRLSFLQLYLVVLAFAVAWGLVFLPTGLPLAGAPQSRLLFALLGAALGTGSVRWEQAMVRRGRIGRGSAPAVAMGPAAGQAARWAGAYGAGSLAVLIAAAVLEELLYRGLFTNLSLALPSPLLAGASLLCVTAYFCLLHIRFGWTQVLAKAPLSGLALGLTLVSGDVVPAVALHAVFNLGAWRSLQV